MAESISGLYGNEIIFEFDADWQAEPSKIAVVGPGLLQFFGGIHTIYDSPKSLYETKIKITANSTDLNSFLFFFASRMGRKKAFWTPDHNQNFSVISIDTTDIVVKGNHSLEDCKRVYILLASGDLVVREITAANYSVLLDQTELVFDGNIAFDLSEGVARATKLKYSRLGNDILEVKYSTDAIAEINISFVELLGEE